MISPGPISDKYRYPVVQNRVYILIHHLDTNELDLWPSLPEDVALGITKALDKMLTKIEYFTFVRKEVPR